MRCKQGRLREELGLSRNPFHEKLVELALRAGFNRAAIVDPRLLPLSAGRVQHLSGEPNGGLLEGMEWPWVTEPAGWSSSSTILICCLSCLRAEPDDLSIPGDPHALVAPLGPDGSLAIATAPIPGLCIDPADRARSANVNIEC